MRQHKANLLSVSLIRYLGDGDLLGSTRLISYLFLSSDILGMEIYMRKHKTNILPVSLIRYPGDGDL